jgi:cyclopropane-fatty-acyl-phospholipid synthase
MSLLERFFTTWVLDGELTVTGPGKTGTYGRPHPDVPPVHLTIADDATARRIIANPELGAAEAWMDGTLTVAGDDIRSLIGLFARNIAARTGMEARMRTSIAEKLFANVRQRNNDFRSKRNVAHHYDLGNDFYGLFLDPERQYSCAYWTDDATTLAEAQAAKMAHIAKKLRLEPGMLVLDIGCGWGGMARFLAREHGVKVLGVTLSEAQLAYARAQAAAEGLDDVARFALVDYRHVEHRFDRIVSVGMFEHVGRPQYDTYFAKVRALLGPDGVALIHTIARAAGPGYTDPFTAKYIFPGGYSPALSEVLPSIEKASLWTADIEIWRLHYARTLTAWYDACLARRAEIEAMYDARFWRMWMFYLAAAWSAFAFGDHMIAQFQLSRRRDGVPLTRDYLYGND